MALTLITVALAFLCPFSVISEDFKCLGIFTKLRYFNIKLSYDRAVRFCAKLNGNVPITASCPNLFMDALYIKLDTQYKPIVWISGGTSSAVVRRGSDGSKHSIIGYPQTRLNVACEFLYRKYSIVFFCVD